MKKFLAVVPLILTAVSPVLADSNVGFDVNISVGNRPSVVVPAPPAVVVPAGPRIIIDEPPLFITPPRLGFYVGVDIPYDMFYISGRYYLWQDNHWYRAPHYSGPWGVVKYKNLPPGLRKHKLERIRYYRDDEYRSYHKDRDHYRGKRFKPGKEYKQRQKQERKHDKSEYKHHGKGKGHGHDD